MCVCVRKKKNVIRFYYYRTFFFQTHLTYVGEIKKSVCPTHYHHRRGPYTTSRHPPRVGGSRKAAPAVRYYRYTDIGISTKITRNNMSCVMYIFEVIFAV